MRMTMMTDDIMKAVVYSFTMPPSAEMFRIHHSFADEAYPEEKLMRSEAVLLVSFSQHLTLSVVRSKSAFS